MNRLSIMSPMRLTRIVQQIVDARERPGNLLWLNRLNIVPVNEKEFAARMINRIKIADHISLNARARVYKNAHLQIVSTELGKIKFGTAWDEEELADLEAWSAANNGVPGANLIANFLVNNSEVLRMGTLQRLNYMATGMMVDNYTYRDPNGVQMQSVTFGMPSNLKTLVSTYWTDHAASNPFADVRNFNYSVSVQYGFKYDRVTMSESMFREIIANTNYEAQAKPYMPINISAVSNIDPTDIQFHAGLFQRITGVAVEFDDTLYFDQRTDGSIYNFRNQPINRVIFSRSAWDNTTQLGDIGNGIVMETKVASYVNGNIQGGSLPSNARGPISYVTAELDPPGLQQWIVMRAWPRKGDLFSSAVMKVAADSYTDSISYISPF